MSSIIFVLALFVLSHLLAKEHCTQERRQWRRSRRRAERQGVPVVDNSALFLLIKLTMEMLSSLQCDGGLQDVCYPAAGGAPFGRPLIEQRGDARHTLLGELQKGAVGAWRDFSLDGHTAGSSASWAVFVPSCQAPAPSCPNPYDNPGK